MRLHVYHIRRIRSMAKDSFTLPRFSLIIFPIVNVKSPEPYLASPFPCHPRCESFVQRFLGLAPRASWTRQGCDIHHPILTNQSYHGLTPITPLKLLAINQL